MDDSVPEQESWSAVEAATNESDAALLVGFFASHGIPARVVDGSFHLTPTADEDLSPIAVAVPSTRLEEAVAVLAKRNAEFDSSPEGDDTVLTDEGAREIDPSSGVEGGEDSD